MRSAPADFYRPWGWKESLGWKECSESLWIPNLRRIWEAESSSRGLCEILAAQRFSHIFIRPTAHPSGFFIFFPEVLRVEKLIVSV